VGEKVKSFPDPAGVHWARLMPFGMYIKLIRGIALRGAANAGDIASRSGKASVAPTPRRNDRRSSAILVMNIGVPSFRAEKILISFPIDSELSAAFQELPFSFTDF
jgi:hypothetical protein